MKNREVNYKNVRYGMLVEVLNDNGYHAGMTVHFYNKKGVLIGNIYRFVPYENLRMREPENRKYRLFFRGMRLAKVRRFLFKILLRITDGLIRCTQPILD